MVRCRPWAWGVGMQVRVGRGRVRLLLASSSVAALLIGSETPRAWAACYTGPFAGGFTNTGTLTCITVNSTSFTGNLVNNGKITPGAPTGISIENASTITGQISNAGTISVGGTGILVQSNSVVTEGIVNSSTISAGSGGILVGANLSISGRASTSVAIPIFSGGIDNGGTISAAGAGIEVGGNIFIPVSRAGGTNNTGSVTISTFLGGITNSGTISAGGDGIGVGGTVSVIGNVNSTSVTIATFSGGVTNGGTISAVGAGIEVGGNIPDPQKTALNTTLVTIATFAGGISNGAAITAGGAGIEVGGNVSLITFVTDAGGGGDTASVMISTFSGGITNSGTISAHGPGIEVGGTISIQGTANTASVTISTFSSGITNSGTISAGGAGIEVGGKLSVVRGSSNSASVTIATFSGGISNNGVVSAGGAGIMVGGNVDADEAGHNTASLTIATFAGGISNSRTITAGGAGIEVGGNATATDLGTGDRATLTISAFSGGITNNGAISAGGPGILVGGNANKSGDNNVASVTISTFAGGITNNGTITAGGAGIEVGGNPLNGNTARVTISTFSGGIVNAGTISARTGILVNNVSTSLGAIVNSGTISGTGGTAIDVSSAHNSITIDQSAGLIAGVIRLSANADVLNVTGGAISGNIVGAGSSDTVNFALGAGNTFTYGAAFTGINQANINSGTVILNGANTATNVDINAGTLAGTGTIAASALTIHTGATFAPGTPGLAGSSMTINGSVVFQPGALYSVQVNPATASFATVSGTATLAGNVRAGFAPGRYLSKDYLILQSGGLNGTFAGLTTSGLPTGFNATLSYNGDDAFLDLAPQLTTSGLNINQANVAAGILNAFNAGAALPPGFVTVFGLTGANQANALTALSGEPASDAQKGAFQLMDDFLVLMLDLSLEGRGGAGGALPFAPDQRAELPPEVASAYASVLKAPAPPNFNQRWSAWGSAFGGYNSTKGDPVVGSNDVIARDYGFAAGMDYRVAPDTIFGFALAGAGTNWGLAQGLGGGRSDAFQAGLYGRTQLGDAYVAGALAFANHWFTTKRTALGDQLTANFDGRSYAVRLEGGYRVALRPGAGITPYAALQSQLFRTPAYSESDLTGGGFGLAYNAVSATDTRSELGARFDRLALLGRMPLILRGRLAWAHDWVSNPAIGAAFEALPGSAFTVNGAAPPKNSALTAASAELKLSSAWSATVKFEGEFGAGAQTYTGTGVLRYTW
jgi:uncharacterized protein with beta-barrel porin domain